MTSTSVMAPSTVPASAPVPSHTTVLSAGAISPTSSSSPLSSPSASESDGPSESRRSRLDRPKLAQRQHSRSIIVPKDKSIGILTDYPADDARAMSPRRDSADIARLGEDARQTLKDQAKTLHSSLQALADRIDEVRSDHDKLENENKFLQDYIGGLTRKMSKSDIQSTSNVKGKRPTPRRSRHPTAQPTEIPQPHE